MTRDVREAVRRLGDGEVICFPTETLWGMACSAFDEAAVRRIYAHKGRPEGMPLAAAFHSWRAGQGFVAPTPLADRLAARFLPGPLSIVVARRGDVLAHLAPGMATLSVRVPDHDDARRILDGAGPLALTSANVHGGADPPSAADVRRLFPDLYVLDGEVGHTASTVVDATGEQPKILREGMITRREVEAAWP